MKIFVDNVERADVPVPSGPGPNQFIGSFNDINIGSLTAGSHTIRVVVDALNEVPETNETPADNERSRTVVAADGKPVVTVSSGVVTYTEGAAPTVLDATATVADPDSADFNGGGLLVDLANTGTADDRLLIRNEGTGSGQIGVSGSNVTFGGAVIGTFSGGQNGSTPLLVPFNSAAATPAAAQALVRNIGFANVSEAPAIAPRSVRFALNDGDGSSSDPVTKALNVVAINDAPTADPQSVTTPANTPRPITLTGSDVDSASLNFIIVTQPEHGTLTGSNAERVYTPQTGYSGPDAFTFKANDGQADSNVATVSITVGGGPNQPPIANSQSVSTPEDTTVAITLTGVDPEGAPLTFTVLTQPQNGSLSGSGPNRTFTPAPNFNGSTSFTFRVNDGQADSNPATVSIDVQPVNDAPVANSQNLVTSRNTTLPITLTGSDVENAPLTFTIGTQPTHGSLTGTGATRTYTPTTDYVGPDNFTFRVNDGQLDSALATVSIDVTGGNAPPTANPQTVTGLEDAAVPVTLTGNDPEGAPLTFSIVAQPSDGTLSGSGANRTFTPAANFNGLATFTFKVSDGQSDSAPATVSIAVTPVNDAPSFNAGPDQFAGPDSGPQTVAGFASAISPGPANENAQIVRFEVFAVDATLFSAAPAVSPEGTLTFTPAPGATGATEVTITARDDGSTANAGVDASAPQTFRITIGGVRGSRSARMSASSFPTRQGRASMRAPGSSASR